MNTEGGISKLTADEIEELKDAFAFFDKDGDGTITIKEIGIVMKSLGFNPTEAELQDIVKCIDEDGNGQIEADEFISLMAYKFDKGDTEQCLQESFQFFDQDGNGLISASELKNVMKKFGENLSEEEVDAMIQAADMQGDGHIEYFEFVRMMTSK